MSLETKLMQHVKAFLNSFQIQTETDMIGLEVNVHIRWTQGSAEQRMECREV